MLVLSTLHTLLSQVLSLPHLHSAILSTPSGQLVCYASDPFRPKDEIRVVVGLSGEIWQETLDNGTGMVDSELGRIMVIPVDEPSEEQSQPPPSKTYQPLMLLTLNSTDAVEWNELQAKGKALAKHLARSLGKYREHLASPKPPPTSHLPSPTPIRYALAAQVHPEPKPRLSPRLNLVKPTETPRIADPHILVAPELAHIRQNLFNLLGSAHPALNDLLHSKRYFLHPSKQLRPLLVLLFARATNGLGEAWAHKNWTAHREQACGRDEELDRPLSLSGLLNDSNPNTPDHAESFHSVFSLNKPHADAPLPHMEDVYDTPFSILPSQLRLAQIVEMIHVASSLHDQVSSSDESFGNKLSILGGDFLLGRASHALSRLGEAEVVELIANVISNTVEGAIWLIKDPVSIQSPKEAWNSYFRRIYLSSASLWAKGARSSVVLGGCREGVWKEVAYAYGRHLGLAHQVVEDAAEYRTSRPPSFSAPLLYAWESRPDVITPIIQRNFSHEGDAETVHHLITESSALERTQELVQLYASQARDALGFMPATFPPSDSRAEAVHSLKTLTVKVAERRW
ncbi:coq1 putative hexaprenyl diphosphate synthase [Paramarasmius palmivorus]|uniref:Coq1 putative hexaprenyl diphosphate synthase n=1 Tax=Paramarasmius palmivorus TaxID=297713 RepID=A0AAW0E429_9AGAR